MGSGFGGPARHLVHTTNCSVTALELQDDIHKEGENLTKRCNLQDRLTHIAGDFLQLDLGKFITVCCIVKVNLKIKFKEHTFELTHKQGKIMSMSKS